MNAPLIAHVVFRFDVGGLENGLVNLLNRLPRNGYRHAVIALTDVTDFARRVRRDDVSFHALNKSSGQGMALWPRQLRLFRQLRPALVHTRNIAALESVVPAALAGVPVRVHGEHGWSERETGRDDWRYQWTRRAYRPWVSHFVALSGEIESHLIERVGVAPRRVSRIVNGVDTQQFRPALKREPIAGCPFSNPSDWLIGTVGRLEVVKNQRALLQAFAHWLPLAPASRRPRLLLVGDGPDRAELQRVAAEWGVADSVWFAGKRTDIDALMRGLDLFVLPSLREGISNTVLEAMATGLPIVATDIPGNRELIEQGVSGFLVGIDDASALARAFATLAADDLLARRLGRAARAAAEQRFSLDRMVASYAALYDRCLAQRAGVAMPATG